MLIDRLTASANNNFGPRCS